MASVTLTEDFYTMMRDVEAMYDSTTPGIDAWAKMNGVDIDSYYNTPYEAVQAAPNAVITKSRTGKVIGTDMVWQAPQEFNPPAVIDSNVPNTTYKGTGYRINGSAGGQSPNVFSSGAKSVSTGAKVMTTAGSVLSVIGAASLGAKLGKAINSNFGGEYAWNEADWEDWVSGLDPLDQSFFRTLFDIDGTAYLPEEMLASMYKMLNDMGAYDAGESTVDPNQDAGRGIETGDISYESITCSQTLDPSWPNNKFSPPIGTATVSGTPTTVHFRKNTGTTTFKWTAIGSSILTASDASSSLPDGVAFIDASGRIVGSASIQGKGTYTYDGKSVTYQTPWIPIMTEFNPRVISHPTKDSDSTSWLMQYGEHTDVLPIDGMENEPVSRAPIQVDPNVITGTTPETILPQLKQNYPQLFDGSISEEVPQEDGTNKTITYIPVPWPDIDATGKPITGTPSQTDPQIAPDTQTDDAIKDLIDTLTDFFLNPPTTGTGDSPLVVVPAGSASSLWKIYNPTQAQVDAFGAWLWDSSFVEQIKKLFNDPMQAIIGIHKVFATPSIGGTATIKVGYLDSEVPSDWVDDQYTTIDCGTVNVREYFGNVFDYSPYTKIGLYLPFIGIVDLDVADVMRGSVKVVYHVDVLTGACLADVKITRDGTGGVIYQYSGSAIVTYPVSSGNYMGMVAGVLSVASGIAGTVLSGGALAPALIGGAVGASHLHTDVSHSGGFSGCAGAMGAKKPYIIISRPQSALADRYNHFTGKPANAHVTLKNCGGMTRVKSVYVGNLNATDMEKDLIEAQLKVGVLV